MCLNSMNALLIGDAVVVRTQHSLTSTQGQVHALGYAPTPVHLLNLAVSVQLLHLH